MNARTPTPEQAAIIEAFRSGTDLVIEAGAGTGKSSTLRMMAEAAPSLRCLYVAYNKAIQTDAAASFPRNATCRTAHSLAYGAVGRQFSQRLNGARMPARRVAVMLGINHALGLDGKLIQPAQVARLANDTVRRFCLSADTEIGARHVPTVNGLEAPAQRAAIQHEVLPLAVKAWRDLVSVHGQLPFSHDVYLKLWSLSAPRLGYDVVMLDEAQDSSPVVAAVVNGQEHAQRCLVGDENQSIYQWRLAVSAMRDFGGKRLQLSKSFRFGQAIADEANKWLEVLCSPLRLTGYERLNSAVQALARPCAVLCRTNAMAISQVMTALGQRQRVALVGGGDQIRRLAEAAVSLKAGQGTDHPELFAFQSWAEVQEYCLAPDTRVLTTDLRWQPIKLLERGDKLVAFDEEQRPGNYGRRWRTATVEDATVIRLPCMRITIAGGTSVIASTDHRWLVRSGHLARWCRSKSLRPGTRIYSMGAWQLEDSRESGWLAGLFDGEGYVGGGYKTSKSRHLGVAQKEGPVLANIRRALKDRRFEFGDYQHISSGVHQIEIKGGVSETLRFLGTVRPERLVAKAERLWNDYRVERIKLATVVSVEPVGEHEVIALATDHRTFIAEGLLSHNCEYDSAGQDLKVLVQLIDQHGPDAVMDAMDHLVPENRADVIISTSHKAKGREWDSVRIATDFREPKEDDSGQPGEPDPSESMLAYVAVTRAKLTLDRGGLAWVDKYVPQVKP